MPYLSLMNTEDGLGPVVVGTWQYGHGSTSHELPPEFPHWDSSTELKLQRDVHLDAAKLRKACGLCKRDSVLVGAEWGAKANRLLRGWSKPLEVPLRDEAVSLVIELRVPGKHVLGTIELTTSVSLGQHGAPKALAAREAGSVLWSDLSLCALEGEAARMPVAEADFSEHQRFPHDDAAWYVDLARNALELPPSAAVQVFINTRREWVTDAAESDSDPLTYWDWGVQSMLYFDVGRSLVSRALDDRDFIDPAHEYPEDTLGAALRRTLRLVFPHETASEIASLKRDRPEDFDAHLRGGLGLLDERNY